MFFLVVMRDFAGYRRGDHVEDQAQIDAILAGENAGHVVRIPPPDQPAPVEPTRSAPVPAEPAPAQ